ncbi:MAG: 6-carboxytetrahydropterin synthase [Bacteroidetes bacterium]|nr:6-carboxytetrahydropterin synthase [Bacteroidota bacterium]
MKVAKEFRWEMGHRLPFHNERCRHLHGHSYKALIELEGDIDENGMVIDFYDVNKIVNPIIDELDHSFLCDKADLDLIEALKKLQSQIVLIDYPSTAENISKYLSDKIIKSILPKNINKLTVRVFETFDSFAEHSVELS